MQISITIKLFRTSKQHTPLKFICNQIENSCLILVIIIHSKRRIFELHCLLVEYRAFTSEHNKETDLFTFSSEVTINANTRTRWLMPEVIIPQYMMIICIKFTPFYENFKPISSRESPCILDSKLWCFTHRKPTIYALQRRRSRTSWSCRAHNSKWITIKLTNISG